MLIQPLARCENCEAVWAIGAVLPDVKWHDVADHLAFHECGEKHRGIGKLIGFEILSLEETPKGD